MRRKLYRTAALDDWLGWDNLRQVWLVVQETAEQILLVVRNHWSVEIVSGRSTSCGARTGRPGALVARRSSRCRGCAVNGTPRRGALQVPEARRAEAERQPRRPPPARTTIRSAGHP